MDKAIQNSISFVDFDTALNSAAEKLDLGIHRLDPTANIRVVWNNDSDIDEKWNELQVDSVAIIWSDHFVSKTGRNKEEVIDIGHLLLEGYFS